MTLKQTYLLALTKRSAQILIMGSALALLAGCGAQGELEPAPPLFDETGRPIVRENERALPDPNGRSRMKNPYAKPVSVSSQPLEGTGNSQRH